MKLKNVKAYAFYQLISLSLTGCAVFSKVMIDERGRQVVCGSWGTGAIGTTAAAASYQACVDRQKAFGFVALEDFEKTEPPKLEERPGLTAPKIGPPLWEVGYVWTFEIGGVGRGQLRQEVVGKEVVDGLTAFILRSRNSTRVLTAELNPIRDEQDGKIIITYIPPRRDYDWPLEVGKNWTASGRLETPTGKTSIYQTVEVKGYGIVRVPAGEFEAFYLRRVGGDGRWLSETWFSPKLRYHVKRIDYLTEGKLIYELLGFSLTQGTVFEVP